MLYPLKFAPVYKEILWGGRNIEKKFGRVLPHGKIAESWEVCCRKDETNTVANGFLSGRTLTSIIDEFGSDLLGRDVLTSSYNNFPLLVKIIDANDKLSVQVHPDDEYARKNGLDNGKTEMWYIIDAKPGAKLIYGLNEGVTRAQFEDAVKYSTIEEVLHETYVKSGDVIYIPAGTIHAILDGILIAEIQQNSNTTYRVFDWNRKDANGKFRELHIKQALDVINFNSRPKNAEPEIIDKNTSFTLKKLCSNDYFTAEEINIYDKYSSSTDGSEFFIYMTIEGNGNISSCAGKEDIHPGDTLFIPSSLGCYDISGHLKVLKIYI